MNDPAEELADELVENGWCILYCTSKADIRKELLAAIRRHYPRKRKVTDDIKSRLTKFTNDLESGVDIRKKYRVTRLRKPARKRRKV